MRIAGGRQQSVPFGALLLDMDGILFHGDRVLPGADDLLRAIAPMPHCFVTNNPIRSPAEVAAHLAALGLPPPDPARVMTSAMATADWLASERPGFRYFAVGAGDLHEALRRVGTEDELDADFVVVGEGPGLDFDSLTTGINLILQRGARLVGTNPDPDVDAIHDGRHRVLPGGGALIAPFAVATGRTPVFIGKPHPGLFRMALGFLGVDAPDCVMIGDRPDTDILGAQRLGMRTALVRTGRFAVADPLPPGCAPDWDVADLPTLLRHWREQGLVPGRG